MIATAIVLIESTDPNVYYYNIIFCIYDVCVYCLMSNFVSDICCIVHLGSKIMFFLIFWSLPSEEGLPSQAQPTQLDDDIAMTQEVTTKCPYTGKEMVHPMKNKRCGHHYEKEGIMQLMKNRKGRAK